MLLDLWAALRGLQRSPLFTLIAVATLALGIGANTAMFSIVNSVLLRPLPGYETDRLVRVADAGNRGGSGYLYPEAFKELRKITQSIELAGLQFCQFNMTGSGDPEQVMGPCTTANWFGLQHANALLGRTFLPDEDQPGRNHVVVLDYAFWQRRFGGDRSIIGKTLIFDKEPWVVIGVMPPDFKPLSASPSPIYTPYVVNEKSAGLFVNGRLKPEVSLGSAQAEMKLASDHLHKLKRGWRNIDLKLTPALEELTGNQRPLLGLLLGAVSFVLLIACANVANLVLARAESRRHEMDVRVALGASRWQITRFALIEALSISVAASVAAIGIAHYALKILKPLTTTLPRADEVRIDPTVLLYSLAAGVISALVFGLAPVLRSLATRNVAGMNARTTSRWQGALVASEVALTFVLLIGAGLLIQTFVAIRSAPLGYNPRNVLTHFFSLPPSADGSRDAGEALYFRLRERISNVPGVRYAATATSMPTGGVSMTMDIQPEGRPSKPHEFQAAIDVVSEDYFRALEIPLRQGREFSSVDRRGTTPVIIVSESVAKRYFGGDAIGKRITIPQLEFNVTVNRNIPAEIIGVAGNICAASVSNCDPEHIYIPERQAALRMTYFVIRTDGDPMALAKSIQRAVYDESPLTPLDSPQTLEMRTAYLTDSVNRGMWLLGAFAALALALAAMGIYGVACFVVSQRRREMGIRMALGGTLTDIAALIYRQSLRSTLLGLAIGALSALWLMRLLEAMLYRVSPFDPVTIGVAALAVLGIVFLATTGPALRAASANPADVLRQE